MKKWMVLTMMCMALGLISCDDGDLLVTSFDFDEQSLQSCTDFEFVYFKINPDNNETLALQFTTSLPFESEIGQKELSLSASNQLTYRRFNSDVSAAYFCNPIPPTSPTVAEEFTSNVGDVTLTTTGELDDADGIPASLEIFPSMLPYFLTIILVQIATNRSCSVPSQRATFILPSPIYKD